MDPWRGPRWSRAVLAAGWREAPYLAQLGVTVIVLGTLGDVVAHAVQPRVGPGPTLPQQTAHLLIVLGMALTLLGVLLQTRRRGSRNRGVGESKEVRRVPRDR